MPELIGQTLVALPDHRRARRRRDGRGEHRRATSVAEARELLAEKDGSVLKAGGIDLLDHMKERLPEPPRVVDLPARRPRPRRRPADPPRRDHLRRDQTVNATSLEIEVIASGTPLMVITIKNQ